MGKETTAYIASSPRCGNICDHPVDTQILDSIKVVPPERFGDPTMEKTKGEEGPAGQQRIHVMVIPSYLISLSSPHPASLLLFLSP